MDDQRDPDGRPGGGVPGAGAIACTSLRDARCCVVVSPAFRAAAEQVRGCEQGRKPGGQRPECEQVRRRRCWPDRSQPVMVGESVSWNGS
jgi:hypothetical protein